MCKKSTAALRDNAQVFELQERIPGARIGTVDKFRGQEAPIVVYSLTTSTQADAPHGMEFLYSLNRSTSQRRERAVSASWWHRPICSSPSAGRLGKCKLANAFCRYREIAETIE
jgi:hypothetical protein